MNEFRHHACGLLAGRRFVVSGQSQANGLQVEECDQVRTTSFLMVTGSSLTLYLQQPARGTHFCRLAAK